MRRATASELRATGPAPETTAFAATLALAAVTRSTFASRTITKTTGATTAETALATLIATPRTAGPSRASITTAFSGRTAKSTPITAVEATAIAARTILR